MKVEIETMNSSLQLLPIYSCNEKSRPLLVSRDNARCIALDIAVTLHQWRLKAAGEGQHITPEETFSFLDMACFPVLHHHIRHISPAAYFSFLINSFWLLFISITSPLPSSQVLSLSSSPSYLPQHFSSSASPLFSLCLFFPSAAISTRFNALARSNYTHNYLKYGIIV